MQQKENTKSTTAPKVGQMTAIFMVCANVIGTGIFTSLGFQLYNLNNGFDIILLWVVGGILAISGSIAYGELAVRIPRSGGEYNYLTQIFGKPFGYITGWISLTAGFAAPIAAGAMTIAKYIMPVILPNMVENQQITVSIFIASMIILALTFIHYNKIYYITSFLNSFVILKILLIVTLIVFCFGFEPHQEISFLPNENSLQNILKPSFAVSLIYVMYAYSGWNAATYIAEEIKNPIKNLPRALIIGTSVVMVLYILLNSAFLISTPQKEMLGKPEVAFVVAQHIFGTFGGKVMSFLISIGLISSLSSMVWAGGNVSKVMGEDYKILKFLSIKNSHNRPYIALTLQMVLVLIMIFTASFHMILEYIGLTLTMSSFLTVVGLMKLKLSKVNQIKHFQKPMYYIFPCIYLIGSFWIIIYVSYQEPKIAFSSFITILSGYLLYLLNVFLENKSSVIGEKAKTLEENKSNI